MPEWKEMRYPVAMARREKAADGARHGPPPAGKWWIIRALSEPGANASCDSKIALP